MQYVDVADLGAHLNEFMSRVQTGEKFVVMQQGHAVARLLPADGVVDEDERMRELERRGLVQVGTGEIPEEFWRLKRAPDPEGKVLAALLEERAESR